MTIAARPVISRLNVEQREVDKRVSTPSGLKERETLIPPTLSKPSLRTQLSGCAGRSVIRTCGLPTQLPQYMSAAIMMTSPLTRSMTNAEISRHLGIIWSKGLEKEMSWQMLSLKGR